MALGFNSILKLSVRLSLIHIFTVALGGTMNLSQLNYFKKLAEVLHYTRAAQELFITQPTLSGAISSLEKELGAPRCV